MAVGALDLCPPGLGLIYQQFDKMLISIEKRRQYLRGLDKKFDSEVHSHFTADLGIRCEAERF